MHYQRKFVREVPEAKNDTFKQFREWLQEVYAVGCPTEEEWGQIMVDDKNYLYHQPYVGPAYDGINEQAERNNRLGVS